VSVFHAAPGSRKNESEQLNKFIDEVALQAAIILMEKHLVSRDLPENVVAMEKYRFTSEFKKLLREHNNSLALTLFGPPAQSTAKNINYYDSAAQKLADIGEKLWKKNR